MSASLQRATPESARPAGPAPRGSVVPSGLGVWFACVPWAEAHGQIPSSLRDWAPLPPAVAGRPPVLALHSGQPLASLRRRSMTSIPTGVGHRRWGRTYFLYLWPQRLLVAVNTNNRCGPSLRTRRNSQVRAVSHCHVPGTGQSAPLTTNGRKASLRGGWGAGSPPERLPRPAARFREPGGQRSKRRDGTDSQAGGATFRRMTSHHRSTASEPPPPRDSESQGASGGNAGTAESVPKGGKRLQGPKY